MHILAFILMIIVASIGAALNGDYSGIAFIGKVMMGIGMFFFFGIIIIKFSTEGSGKIFVYSIFMILIGGIMTLKDTR